MKPSSKVYWGRVVLAVLTALIATVLGITGLNGILFAVIMYVASYYIIKYGLNIDQKSLGSGNLRTIGIGAFFFIWIMSWVLFYTILHP
ncbi:MAG TPA: hypothetical protein VED00_01075 [archaeon]|nr:hypothetical protein [archaeon]